MNYRVDISRESVGNKKFRVGFIGIGMFIDIIIFIGMFIGIATLMGAVMFLTIFMDVVDGMVMFPFSARAKPKLITRSADSITNFREPFI